MARQADLPNNEVRAHAITDLVTVRRRARPRRQKGVTPAKQTYERPADEIATLDDVVPDGDDAKTVRTILENSGEIRAIAIALGEQSTGQTATEANQEELSRRALTAITKAFKEHDVEISPRFGAQRHVGAPRQDRFGLGVRGWLRCPDRHRAASGAALRLMRIVVMSPRVAPGILTLAAWDALRDAVTVHAAEDDPHVRADRRLGHRRRDLRSHPFVRRQHRVDRPDR